MEPILWLLAAFTSATVGALIALWRCKSPVVGAAVSFFLGPVGWLAVALWEEARCPLCRGVVARDAKVCRHCGAAFAPARTPPLS